MLLNTTTTIYGNAEDESKGHVLQGTKHQHRMLQTHELKCLLLFYSNLEQSLKNLSVK